MLRLLRIFSNSRLWLFYSGLIALAFIGVLLLLAPAQVPVAVYKLCLLMLSGIAGFCIDRAIFPYAEPSSYLVADWRHEPDADNAADADFPVVERYKAIFAVAMVRQALLIVISMLAVGLGL